MPSARAQLTAMACVVTVVASAVTTISAFNQPTVAAALSARWLPDSATTWFQLSNGSAPLSLTTGVEPGDPSDTGTTSAGIATLYESAVVQGRPATRDFPYSPYAAERILVAGKDGIHLAGGLLAGRRTRFLPRPLLLPARPKIGQVWSAETTLEIFGPDGTTTPIALKMGNRVERIDADRCATITRTVTGRSEEADRISETWCPGRGRVRWQEQEFQSPIRVAFPAGRPILADPAGGRPFTEVLDGNASWIRQPVAGPAASGQGLLADPSAPPLAVPGAVVDFGSRVAAATALDARDGGVKWQLPTSAPPIGRALIDDGVLVVASAAGSVAGVDPDTGFVRWRKQAGAVVGIAGTPSGTAVIGGWDGTILALQAATGAQRWSHRVSGPIVAVSAIDTDTVTVDAAGRLTVLDELGRETRSVALGHIPSGDLATTDGKIIVGTNDGHVLVIGLDGSVVSDIDVSPVSGVRLMVSGSSVLAWESSGKKGEISAVVVNPEGFASRVFGVGVVAATPLPDGWFTVTDDLRYAVISLEGAVGSIDHCGICQPATLPLAVGPDLWLMAPAKVLAVANGAP